MVPLNLPCVAASHNNSHPPLASAPPEYERGTTKETWMVGDLPFSGPWNGVGAVVIVAVAAAVVCDRRRSGREPALFGPMDNVLCPPDGLGDLHVNEAPCRRHWGCGV